MAKQTVPDLKELFKQASEIAQQVPRSMQEAAFHRAIDLLTKTLGGEALPEPRQTKRGAGATTRERQADVRSVESLLQKIDSTEHPGVRSARKVLDRSLMVLQIARIDHDVDGLSPTDISRILTDKFRISTSRQAVSMALCDATNLVNRNQQGQAFVYRIMGPGEDYLAHLGDRGEGPAAPAQLAGRAVSRKITKKTVSAQGGGGPKESRPKDIRSAGLGPKAAILELIRSGFFATAKTGPEVQAYLKRKRGFDLGTDQLRLAMLRLVRDRELEREENDEGAYEYRHP